MNDKVAELDKMITDQTRIIDRLVELSKQNHPYAAMREIKLLLLDSFLQLYRMYACHPWYADLESVDPKHNKKMEEFLAAARSS